MTNVASGIDISALNNYDPLQGEWVFAHRIGSQTTELDVVVCLSHGATGSAALRPVYQERCHK